MTNILKIENTKTAIRNKLKLKRDKPYSAKDKREAVIAENQQLIW